MAGRDFRSSNVVDSHCLFGRRARGFTLVELIAVIVVLGVLSAMGASRFMDSKAFSADVYADTMRATLRYGQKIAIAQNRNVYVRLNGSSVALCYDAACAAGNRVATPAGNTSISTTDTAVSNCDGDARWYCEPLPASVSYAVSPAAGALFYFDQKGKPFAATDPVGDVSSLLPVVITISGAGGTRSMTVERETGYVH